MNNNKTENESCIFSPDFDEIKSTICVCPADGVTEDLPFSGPLEFYACGLSWNFIIPSGDFWLTVNDSMLESWNVSAGYLIQTVKQNIDRHLNEIAYTTLFGNASEDVTLPFMKIHFAKKESCPPFGVSLMLSDAVISRIHWYIGDFFAFPVDLDSFYAISKAHLNRYCLDPMQSFNNILNSHPEENPMFFQDELLFYGTKKVEVPEQTQNSITENVRYQPNTSDQSS